MGNQTLVPSQIQTVESYFLDLKNYVQFKASLGSTTFMKTARVSLIEALIYEEFIASHHHQLNDQSTSYSATSHPSSDRHQPSHNIHNTNDTNKAHSSSTSNLHTSSAQFTSKLTQLQLYKARMLELRELQQQVVVKVFPKYDASVRLDLYAKRVREIKSLVYTTYSLDTNLLPFSDLVITDRAAFLFRQFIKYNLYDRMSTRPFLTQCEKKWIAYQLLAAVNEVHSLGIVHGDIKPENVLVNSFLWVSLTDFASYKPVYLSKNHPSADFNYYFDISRRRTCYLAPERVEAPHQQSLQETDIMVDEVMPPDPLDFKSSMDIFSLGCVIAELFMERPLFDFAKLLAYRDGKYEPYNDLVNEIKNDKPLLDMILSMLSLEPGRRKTANEYLQEQNDRSFPSYFVYLKNYIKGFISTRLTPDEIAIRLRNDLPLLLKNFKLNLSTDTRSIDEMLLKSSLSTATTYKLSNTNDAFLILLSLLLSCIRKIKFAENKLIAVDLLTHFSKFLDAPAILDRCLPYYLILLDENTPTTASVKAHVVYALNDCLASIHQLDLHNMNIFPEIIFTILESLSRDDSFLVRSAVAKTISSFALTSLRYLDTGFLTKRTLLNEENSQHHNTQDTALITSYDKEYEHYQTRVTEIVMQLITDINPNATASNAVKETLIRSDISKLCSFFSRQKTSEFLLPHMITILNEKTDWSVRAAFFDALCPVLSCIGWESVEIVKSLLEQGLHDSEEFVIYRTLNTLSKMVEIGLLERQQILYFLSSHITVLLCHPSLWIRHGAINFITVVCKQQNKSCLNVTDTEQIIHAVSGLNAADVLCSVAPLLSKSLAKHDYLLNYDREEILFSCLKLPVKRQVYDAIAQDGRSDQLFCYLQQRSEIRTLTNQNYLPGYVDCSDAGVQQFFEKLVALGLREEDEDKLLHMKDFIEKTRISRLSSSLHNTNDMLLMTSSSSSLTANGGNGSGCVNQNIGSKFDVWNTSKESFMTKDGCVIILKDKFQRLHVEYLNSRRLAGFPSGLNQNAITATAQTVSATSSSNATASSEKQESKSDHHHHHEINAEWKLMFGDRSGGGLSQDLDQSKPVKPGQAHNKPVPTSHHSLNQSLAYLMNNKNCIVEVEKYLDREKLIYEDHKLKRDRCDRAKETINASISSHIVSLSASHQKWRPRGLLVAHSNEHTKSITRLARNYNSTYFASCSAPDQSVKIWSTDSLLDVKSGFFKSIFTYDKNTPTTSSPSATTNTNNSIQPACTAFYDKHSLAILGEDFRFHVIDFNSSRTQYHLYTHEKLFKPACSPNLQLFGTSPARLPRSYFYYLNKSFKNHQLLSTRCNSNRQCLCASNSPIEMIYLDDSAPTWPLAATNLSDYFKTTTGNSTSGLFCYSTSSGAFSCIDLRTRSKAFDVRRDLRKGYITAMTADPWHTWLAMGTSYGAIEIYDFRFMLPVATFEHRSRTAVTRMCNHPISTQRLCASYQGNNEIAVWNMASASSNQQRRFKGTDSPEFVFWGVQSVPPLCQNKMSSYYVSGLVGCASSSEDAGLIATSTDMKIRYIDLSEDASVQARDSFMVSSAFQNFKSAKSGGSLEVSNRSQSFGSEFASSGSLFSGRNVSYEVRQIEGTRVMVEIDQSNSGASQMSLNTNLAVSYNSPALTHQSQFTHHQDAISDLVVCYNHFGGKNVPLMMTGSRDGALKIWK